MIEIGQRIHCRERLWEVLDVRGSAGKELIRAQALGMERKLELTFVNPVDHIEILPPGEIKWHLAAPSRWRHLQNAFLWSMNHGEGCLVSLSRGRIALEDYQLEPALKALGLPRQRILIGDDVGLGKTIEAGMLILELIARGRGNRILIIVPASLQDQWADEMADKFGLDFVVYDSNMIREVRSTLTRTRNPWELNHRIITSIDFVKARPNTSELEVRPLGCCPCRRGSLPCRVLSGLEGHENRPLTVRRVHR
ncbi:MAG: SNF2-related protein [Thermoplasmata archaeon]